MPLIGEFHTFYWETSDTNAAVVHLSGGAGYPAWQGGVIAPSLFGMVGAWIDTKRAQYRWWRQWFDRIRRLDAERRQVLDVTLTALEGPSYRAAQTAVRQTATTLGFNRPEAWRDYSRELKSDPGRMENVYRHLKACHLLRAAAGSTMTNPQQNLIVELAYHGFARRGR